MTTAREPDRFSKKQPGLRRDYTPAPQISKSYLLGILHDATERKTTFRISQKSEIFVKFIAKEIKRLGSGAWVYKEGKNRNVYVVEFSKSFLKGFKIKTRQDKIDYIRGYFDSEGGIAHHPKVRFYIYFSQKDINDLKEVKQCLKELNISCGKTHNPSKKVDPDYWRFYILSKSYKDFAKIIGSFHPIKNRLLRMKR
ncbi:LAGLIDADG family homing endonuclease [Patescibacteria group bacterium]|nr:LAGLIDADG family homing endonuclease [Patescibacteria group bacterium]MCG2702627.1 LAGLIDADG family homing endonuclease [Candidatus Parcubacteria bacterium]MBU4265479.1 LAGLIDADG family homing endonuclease [Patescibacteria group bacterium]MBU4390529.1 LAGLIDADG family homing endonuclease [Patescibacteria group bacterium]MBU4397660.1 LAGLIDADG family homing endonuclease [Patescibacteria group bacterium]